MSAFPRIFAVFAVAIAGMSVAARADAGCFSTKPEVSIASLAQAPSYQSRVGAVATTQAVVDPTKPPSIVGLWHVLFTTTSNDVGIPPGTVIDDAYATWHSDGTEIMNSSRDPATSSFCLGVWDTGGGRTYKLNHFALSWDNTGALCVPQQGATSCLVGRTNIRERITVDPHGDTYSGVVTIDQYDTSGKLLFRLKGLVSAQRVTAD